MTIVNDTFDAWGVDALDLDGQVALATGEHYEIEDLQSLIEDEPVDAALDSLEDKTFHGWGL